MARTEYDHMINKYRHRYLDDSFKDLEISRAEAPYLLKISKEGTMHMNTLISELPFHKSHTTRAINQLERDGLIIKEINPEDKRAYVLTITEKGRILGEKVKSVFTKWEDLINAVVTDEERQMLSNLTKKIYHLLREYYNEEDTINEIND